MTETSYFWDGLVTGDAILSPYSSDVWHSLWQTMFSRGVNEGVIDGIEGELIVSGVLSGICVATGRALVDGTVYENNSAVSVTIDTPVTNPRIDRIVIQKDWSTKTIRIALLSGTEAGSPSAPSLTQTAGSIWEIPLAQVLITTAGVITITDEIEPARTRLGLIDSGFSLIGTAFVSDGTPSSIIFSSIPATFKHLEMHGNILTSPGSLATTLYFNGDNSITSYNREAFGRAAGSVAAAGNQGTTLPLINGLGSSALDEKYNTQLFFRIANYKDTTFYKTSLQKEVQNVNDTAADLGITIEEFLWMNTDAINRIDIRVNSGTFRVGTTLALYGIS